MLRILHVLGKTDLGGAESRIMDLYRQIDRENVQFDVLCHSTEKGYFDDEIEKLGGHIYRVPRFKMYNFFSYKTALKDFFAAHGEFRAVQGHMTSTAAIYLPIAKKAGVSFTIAHARSAGVDKGFKGILTKWLRRNLSKRADYLFTCSQIAGEAVFGKKAMEAGRVVFIPNAIDAAEFIYDESKRSELRERLNIADKLVIGHVGRFHYAKNHEYLLQIFALIYEKRKDAVLLLLGVGPGMEAMQELAVKLGIKEQVLFLGNRVPVSDYYQAMDYFVYPSRFEGLPGTVVEAQAAGLRCLISDTIAEEVVFGDLVQTMSIETKPQEWADKVLETLDYPRENQYEVILQHGFDSRQQAKQMLEFYETGKTEGLTQ